MREHPRHESPPWQHNEISRHVTAQTHITGTPKSPDSLETPQWVSPGLPAWSSSYPHHISSRGITAARLALLLVPCSYAPRYSKLQLQSRDVQKAGCLLGEVLKTALKKNKDEQHIPWMQRVRESWVSREMSLRASWSRSGTFG